MSLLGVIMYATVALWLAPGSLWRPVALVLLIQWGVGEFIFSTYGDFVPLSAYVPLDIAVIFTVLFFRSHWSDWLIIAPYPAVWWLYFAVDGREQWLALYWIALAQFVLAGPWPQLQRGLHSFSHGSVKAFRKAL